MSDFFSQLEALEDTDFFESLDMYDPCPRKVGDKFTITAPGYGRRPDVYVLVKFTESKTLGGTDVIYTLEGSDLSKYCGVVHQQTLEEYSRKGWARKVK